jgi:signal peptidase I
MADDETGRAAAKATKRSRRPRLSWWQETVVLVVVAVLVSVLVKAFFVQMFYVPSASMKPEFVKNDRILVEKVSYWNGDVHRGDVVVFRDPGRWLGVAPQPRGLQEVLSVIGLYPAGGHLVKRVIGVGGDHVECCDDRGRVMVNDVPLDESEYLRAGMAPSQQQFDVVVPADSLWMMGDNRSNSADSRAHQRLGNEGAVPADDVVGKVWAIAWPWGRIEVLDDPEVFDDPDLDTQSG